jgi:hypothetical protein
MSDYGDSRDDRDRDYRGGGGPGDIPRGPRGFDRGRPGPPPVRGRGAYRGRGFTRDYRDFPPRDRSPPPPLSRGVEDDYRRPPRDAPLSAGSTTSEPAGGYGRSNYNPRWNDYPAGRGRPIDDRERDRTRPRSRSRERRWERDPTRLREEREERARIEREEREKEAERWKQQKRQTDGKPNGTWPGPTTPYTTTSPRLENRQREFPERRLSSSAAPARERGDYFSSYTERISGRTASPPAQSPPVPAFGSAFGSVGSVGQRSTSWKSPVLPPAQQAPQSQAQTPVPVPSVMTTTPTMTTAPLITSQAASQSPVVQPQVSPAQTNASLSSPPRNAPTGPKGLGINPPLGPKLERVKAPEKSPISSEPPVERLAVSSQSPTLTNATIPTGPRAEREGRGRGVKLASTTPRPLSRKRDHTGAEIDPIAKATESASGLLNGIDVAIKQEDVEMHDAVETEPIEPVKVLPRPRHEQSRPQSKSILNQIPLDTPDDTMDEEDDMDVGDFEANDKRLTEEIASLQLKLDNRRSELSSRVFYVARLEETLSTFVEDEVMTGSVETAPLPEVTSVLRDVTNRAATPLTESLPYLSIGSINIFQENPDFQENGCLDTMKQRIAEDIRKRRQNVTVKQQKLLEEYEGNYKPWVRQVAYLEDQAKKPADAEPNATDANGALLTPSLEGRRAARGNYIVSELGLEQFMKETAAQEEQQRVEREAKERADIRPDMSKEAEIPDMIVDEVEILTTKFNDTNLLLTDRDSIRSRFCFIPPKDTFTEDEQTVFIKNFLTFPKKWGKIAQDLESRTYKDCIHHYYLTKHQARYKQQLNTRGRRRTGRRPKQDGRPKANALMADLGITPELYRGDEFEQPPVSDTGRPRRAAAPVFGEPPPNANASGGEDPGRRGNAGTPKDDTDNPMERGAKRQRAKTQRKPRTQAAQTANSEANSAAPSPQKVERPKNKDIIIENSPPPQDVSETPPRRIITQTPVLPPEYPSPVKTVSIASAQQTPAKPISHTHVQPPPPAPPTKPMVSIKEEKSNSYWTGFEHNDFRKLVEYFGSDIEKIAFYMTKKTLKMVQNQFKKLVEKSGSELSEIAGKADERIRRDGGYQGLTFPILQDGAARKKAERMPHPAAIGSASANGTPASKPVVKRAEEGENGHSREGDKGQVQGPGAGSNPGPSTGPRYANIAPTQEQPPQGIYQPILAPQSSQSGPSVPSAASSKPIGLQAQGQQQGQGPQRGYFSRATPAIQPQPQSQPQATATYSTTSRPPQVTPIEAPHYVPSGRNPYTEPSSDSRSREGTRIQPAGDYRRDAFERPPAQASPPRQLGYDGGAHDQRYIQPQPQTASLSHQSQAQSRQYQPILHHEQQQQQQQQQQAQSQPPPRSSVPTPPVTRSPYEPSYGDRQASHSLPPSSAPAPKSAPPRRSNISSLLNSEPDEQPAKSRYTATPPPPPPVIPQYQPSQPPQQQQQQPPYPRPYGAYEPSSLSRPITAVPPPQQQPQPPRYTAGSPPPGHTYPYGAGPHHQQPQAQQPPGQQPQATPLYGERGAYVHPSSTAPSRNPYLYSSPQPQYHQQQQQQPQQQAAHHHRPLYSQEPASGYHIPPHQQHQQHGPYDPTSDKK